jgi:hypothetical protein
LGFNQFFLIIILFLDTKQETELLIIKFNCKGGNEVAFSYASALVPDKTALPLFSAHTSGPIDGLTSYLREQCTEVQSGLKPATLVSLVNRIYPCGSNLYQDWMMRRLKTSPYIQDIRIAVLQSKENSLLLFCYSEKQLERHLSHTAIRNLLHKAGYETSASMNGLLAELKHRIDIRDSFPYEIGLFIGYPANLLDYYDDPFDCLTAHLMLECSEVLAGVKPANLLSMVNRARPCGRNLHHIWQSRQKEVVSRLNKVCFIELQAKEKSVLLLCYNRAHLEQHLAHAGIRTLLCKAGYDKTASLDQLLAELKKRVTNGDTFPHEIGLFIGYPAKDVAAFMGLIKLPFACQGPWKIYGDPLQSLGLAEQYRCCRQRMCAVLASGNHEALDLHNPEHPFFCQAIDKNYQYRKETGLHNFRKGGAQLTWRNVRSPARNFLATNRKSSYCMPVKNIA